MKKAPDFAITDPDLQFVLALAFGVLFGVLGVAGVIPFWFATLALLACMFGASFALWRSKWLESRSDVVRGLVVFGFVVLYCSAAYPALVKLLEKRAESAVTPTVIQNATDCAANVNGDGNKVGLNCDDKSNSKK